MAGWFDADRALDRAPRWVAADVALAALLCVITVESIRSDAYVDLYGPVEGVGWLLAVTPTLLLPTRRFVPVAALGAATLLYLWISAVQGDSNAPLAAPFFAYAVGVTRPIGPSATLVGTAALVLSTTTLYGPGDPDAVITVAWFVVLTAGWLAAVGVRGMRARTDALSGAVSELEVRQEEIAREAVADERLRIARELHDAVGHAVNVIVLQAGAANLTGDRDRALEALAHIETVGRHALIDLDHLLGLLRDDEQALRTPQRTVDDLVDLVDQLRRSGVNVELRNECDVALDWRTAAAVYRITQEALTNAVKHAAAERIDVQLFCNDGAVRLSVLDDGVGVASPSSTGGRGIPGMTERAAVLGGTLTAGPRTDGGYLVEALLPLGRQDPTRSADREVAP